MCSLTDSLRKVYLAVDYEARGFELATMASREVIPNPVPFRDCTSSRLSGTAISLIVVGVVLGILSLCLATFWFWRRRRV